MTGAEERARAYLARRGADGEPLVALAGDASARRYFRAGPAGATRILLVEPEPGGARTAPFVSIGRFLETHGLAPPRILDRAEDLGLLVLEDLGDVSLRRALEAAAPGRRRELFAQALDLVAALQGATGALTPEVHAYHVRFDREVFGRELAMFADRYLVGLRRTPPPPAARAELDAALDWLAGALAAVPQVLTHRDYHIDNLHVVGGRLRVIDFQDARLGPAAYDAASLLTDRDVHRFLDAGGARALLDRFVAGRGLDPARFAREYRLAVVQRGLKATGTFADQALRRGRRGYLEYIPPTLDRVRAAAAGTPELEPVLRALAAAG